MIISRVLNIRVTFKRIVFAVLVIFLSLMVAPTSMAADEPVLLGDGSGGIYGQIVNSYACWSLDSSKQRPMFQLLVNNKWITKATGKVYKNSTLCSDSEYPFVVNYQWRLDVKGQTYTGNSYYKTLKYRQYLPAKGTFKSFTTPSYTFNVYLTKSDWDKYVNQLATETVNRISQESISPIDSGSGPCYKNGKPLFGQIYITKYPFEADVKVYVTKYSFESDLKVFWTKYSFDARSCGLWYATQYSFDADTKVYFTQYSFEADIKIYETKYSFEAGKN